MMEQVFVGLGERSYPIWIGDGILSGLGDALRAIRFPRRIALVTNSVVGPLYAGEVTGSLISAGFQVSSIQLPDGEEHKNLQTLTTIYDALIREGFDRFSGLVALGGGVIGDMVGFAAATYLRGIPFVQVPTTLLSQVDSSVGGKTGVNHPLGKNLIGAFYQPRHVHIDVATLQTLPEREFSAGMAEVVKYGVIRDRNFFEWLSNNRDQLRRRERSVLVAAVKRSCHIKADVVENDEKESSLRAILNYGHTFGHAVETLAGYGEYRHGEAVAIGMAVAAELSCALGLCRQDEVAAIRDLLVAFQLPVVPPPIDCDEYLAAMGRDKKVKEGVMRFVFNRGIGDCVVQDLHQPELLLAGVLERLQQPRMGK